MCKVKENKILFIWFFQYKRIYRVFITEVRTKESEWWFKELFHQWKEKTERSYEWVKNWNDNLTVDLSGKLTFVKDLNFRKR